jgi:hypothetical protein
MSFLNMVCLTVALAYRWLIATPTARFQASCGKILQLISEEMKGKLMFGEGVEIEREGADGG